MHRIRVWAIALGAAATIGSVAAITQARPTPAATPTAPAPDVDVAAAVTRRVHADGSARVLVLMRNGTPTRVPLGQAPGRAQSTRTLTAALRKDAMRGQAALVTSLRRARIPFRSYWIVNAIALRADRHLLAALRRREDVAAILSDADVPVRDAPRPVAGARRLAAEWGVERIRAPTVWSRGAEGQGIVVGIPDSGAQWNHPALATQYLGSDGTTARHDHAWWDAVHGDIDGDGGSPCGFSATAPCDDDGHGTFVTGIAVGGEGANRIGVAPRARWIACRSMDRGVGRPSTYIECLQFFLAPTDLGGRNPDPARRPDVVSNSWVCPPEEGCDSRVLQPAIDAMHAAGIFMAAAAGNDGPGCSTIAYPPPIAGSVFTVGGTEEGDVIRPTSSRGPITVDGSGRPKPDVVAPGTRIRSAYPPNDYRVAGGTSAAAPHVAGAVALLWSAFPWLRRDVERTERLLRESAVPVTTTDGCGGDTPTQVPNNTFGAGRIDVAAAYERALAEAPDTVGPRLTALRVVPAVATSGRAVTARFRLTERAQVTLRYERRVGARYVRLAPRVVAAGRAGANAVRLVLRAGGRSLAAGSYRLVAQPRDPAGNAGGVVRAPFRVSR
jgi:serine protease AprX